MNNKIPSRKYDYQNYPLVSDVLDSLAEKYPEKGFVYWKTDGTEVRYRYPEVQTRARKILDALRKAGIKQGDKIVMETEEPEFYHAVFWACMYGGIVISSIQQPQSWDVDSTAVEIFMKQIGKLDMPVLLTQRTHASYYQEIMGSYPDLKLLVFEDLKSDTEAEPAPQKTDDPIYIQFSSGTTGIPQGAVLTHRNIVYCCEGTASHIGLPAEDTAVSWLPHTHNLGIFVPMVVAMMLENNCCFTQPAVFLHDPASVLKKVSALGGTWFCTNNFLMEWMSQRVPDAVIPELNLSGVHGIFAGAEVISRKTISSLTDKYGVCGLDREAIRPGYGMTEATVVVSVTLAGQGTVHDVISRDSLMREQRAVPVDENTAADAVCYLSNGTPLRDLRVRITDEERNALPERMVGEIEVQGDLLFQGYYNEPESTAEKLRDGWLCTGDLGYMVDRHIFIVGRKKDVVIIRGVNYIATDIEECISAATGIPKMTLAVTGIMRNNQEELGVFIVNQDAPEQFAKIADAVRQAVLQHYHLELELVLPVEALPKTGSGKVKRYQLKMQYESGVYAEIEKTILALCSRRQKAEAVQVSAETRIDTEGRVIACWSKILNRPAAEISREATFYESGGNSIQAYRLILEMSREFGMNIGQEVFAKYNTVAKMTDYLSTYQEQTESAGTESHIQEEQVVISGIGLRLPDANTPEQFWENLLNGRDSVAPPSEERKKLAGAAEWNDPIGMLSDIDSFDYDFFEISREEAKFMDPQQRMVMEAAYEALEDAGILQDEKEHENVGVYACTCYNSYLLLIQDHVRKHGCTELPQRTLVNNMNNMIAARISHQYGFVGPVMAVDTACSAFMAGVHLARNAILQGEIEGAVIVGSNMFATRFMHDLAKQAGIVAPSGVSKVFDENADGSIMGEGIVVFYMQKKSDAIRNHSQIYGIVHGTAINNDGYALSVTSPNPRGEYDVLRKAYENADVTVDDISYIEAHGTGTVIGDPIEINALSRQFSGRKNQEKIPVGSVKTNIGHLLPAAPAAGILKALLCINHRKLVASLHMEHINPLLNIEDTPFRLLSESEDWIVPEGGRRVAGVTSLGLGGTNAHLIVGEYIPEQMPERKSPHFRQVLTVSAKSPEALEKMIADTLEVLNAPGTDASVLCMTRNRYRRHYAYRAACMLDENGKQTGEIRRGVMHRQTPSDVQIQIGDTGCGTDAEAFRLLSGKLMLCKKLIGRFTGVTGSGIYHWIAEYVNGTMTEEEACRRYTAGEMPSEEAASAGKADLILRIGAASEAAKKSAIVLEGRFAPEQDDDVYENLLQLYLNGAVIRWDVLYPAEGQQVMHLPSYPFVKNHVWVD